MLGAEKEGRAVRSVFQKGVLLVCIRVNSPRVRREKGKKSYVFYSILLALNGEKGMKERRGKFVSIGT